MNAKSIQLDQVEIQHTASDHPHTDGHADEYSLLPGFINFYQNAQQIQSEPGQLYVTNDADPHDMGISMRDDINLQLAKMYPR
jgi:hypothetical protein